MKFTAQVPGNEYCNTFGDCEVCGDYFCDIEAKTNRKLIVYAIHFVKFLNHHAWNNKQSCLP